MSTTGENSTDIEELDTVSVGDPGTGAEFQRTSKSNNQNDPVRENTRTPLNEPNYENRSDSSLLIDGGGRITSDPVETAIAKEEHYESEQGNVVKPEKLIDGNTYDYSTTDGEPNVLVIDSEALEGEYAEQIANMAANHEGKTTIIGKEAYGLLEEVETTDRELNLKEVKNILNGDTEEINQDISYLTAYQQTVDTIHQRITDGYVEKIVDEKEEYEHISNKHVEKALQAKQDLAYLEALQTKLGDEIEQDGEAGRQIRYTELAVLLLDDLVQKESFLRSTYTDQEEEILRKANKGIQEEIIDSSPLEDYPKPHRIDNNIDIREEIEQTINPSMQGMYATTKF